MTIEKARELVKNPLYLGCLIIKTEGADGQISGAESTTGDTLRPALQIIKTRPNVTRTSGAFLMVRGTERYLFGDCAININPDAEALAEIAINSAITAKMFGIEPKIAMLSYSTKVQDLEKALIRLLKQLKLLTTCVLTLKSMGNCNLMQPLFQKLQL